jgi:hypothetical protein
MQPPVQHTCRKPSQTNSLDAAVIHAVENTATRTEDCTARRTADFTWLKRLSIRAARRIEHES